LQELHPEISITKGFNYLLLDRRAGKYTIKEKGKFLRKKLVQIDGAEVTVFNRSLADDVEKIVSELNEKAGECYKIKYANFL